MNTNDTDISEDQSPELSQVDIPADINIDDTQQETVAKQKSSRMTQLMIFVNGIILTITAYATLSVFINEMTRDHYTRISENILTETKQYLSTVEKDFSIANMLWANRQQSTLVELLPELSQAKSETSYFSQLVSYEYDSANNAWSLVPILGQPGSSGLSENDRSHLKTLLPLINTDTGETIMRISPSNTLDTKTSSSNDFLEETQNIIQLARPEMNNGRLESIFIGYVAMQPEYFLSDTALRNKIASMTIKDSRNDLSVYKLKAPERITLSPDTSIREPQNDLNFYDVIPFANTELKVSLSVQEDLQLMFLTKVPYLLILFGFTMTLIGTLYVRNNYLQSQKLNKMNKALGEQNEALEKQIKESDRLFNALERSEHEYRAVIDSVADIIFEINSDGDILFLNKSWKSLTDLDLKKSLGKNIFDYLAPAERDEAHRYLTAVLKGEDKITSLTTKIVIADTFIRNVILKFSMIRNDANHEKRIVGTFTDIEDQIKAEHALSEAEKKYQTIVENAAGGIYQITKNGKIISANPSLANILGYRTPEELIASTTNIGQDFYIDYKDRQNYERQLQDKGFIRAHEARMRKKDGSIIWVNENARCVRDESTDDILYYEGSIEDITKRKNAENGLREAKIQSDLASRAKSEFLANISHELRTPLNAIIGFSEIIKNQALGSIENNAYAEYAGDIYNSGTKLLAIINEILDISKIDAGERQLNESVVDIKAITQSVTSLYAAKSEIAGITIENQIDSIAPKLVGEELAIKQMITNLISNAIKFTPSGGKVTLSYSMDSRNGDFFMSVTDTGIGIDEKDITKALSPFGQLNNDLDRKVAGTGLGLTLVNSLIKLHHGKLHLESQLGVGTTATLVFPAGRVSHDGRKADDTSSNNVTFLKPRS